MTATGQGGVFPFFDHVFRDSDEEVHAATMGGKYADKADAKKKKRYYREWRTFQMSDHFSMWIELRIDYSREYLRRHRVSEANSTRVIV